ncbi:MAG: glycerol-3-phosphate dehydrogenase/oxidase [Pseudomonadota bacterium]|nr:glycerol-3-phosphate dehydrogenase/oxidase [Pseudomonadota bacterium]
MRVTAWNARWREQALPGLATEAWDLIVVGGGISGAGILREAARRGWKCLLVEQRDFAWGTSSRSSKMVHGGLRYVAKGHFRLTHESVRERQRLLGEAPGLVDPLGYVFPHYRGVFPGPRVMGGLLTLYDLLAGRRDHRYAALPQLHYLLPGLKERDLLGGSLFTDALTDDARLVMRVLSEARAAGGEALNGLRVVELCRDGDRVAGLLAEDSESGRSFRFRSRAIALATGAWSDRLRRVGGHGHIRPLRGSHLLLPSWRLPLAHALSFLHAADGRPIFIFPWEGATVIGTTDLDHREDLDREPRISAAEVDYLLAACAQQFPAARIGPADVLSTWAGVRPVVSSGAAGTRPSDETREHALWSEPGCVAMAGGKLTTFRPQALDVLRACAPMIGKPFAADDGPTFGPLAPVPLPQLAPYQQRRLCGRHGRELPALAALLAQLGSEKVGASETLWAELALAAGQELVLHLDDLLLRRTRLGLLLAGGAAAELPRIRQLCQPRLGWSDERWQQEEDRYLALWRRCYSLPAPAAA